MDSEAKSSCSISYLFYNLTAFRVQLGLNETDINVFYFKLLLKAVQVPPLRIKVEYLGHIKNILGSAREEEVEINDEASIVDLLIKLCEKYGEPFRKAIYQKGGSDVKPNYVITVNGYLLNQLDGVKTKLRNGDHVALMPIVSGG
jgi:MoaD family protein